MSSLKAGFARQDITPPLGIPVAGYYEKRYAKEILDPLDMHAIAFSNGDKKAIILNKKFL